MTMKSLKFVFLFCLTIIVVPCGGVVQKFYRGECPHVDSMPAFEMDRYLGQWIVLQNYNDNAAPCLRENFTVVNHVGAEDCDEDDHPPPVEMIVMARNEVAPEKTIERELDELTKLKRPKPKVYGIRRSYFSFGDQQIIHETGKIKFMSNVSEAEMEINFPCMLNSRHYQVIATDYERYSLVWRCQKTIFGHRRSAQIMSRKPTLDAQALQELRTLLRDLEMNANLHIDEVKQNNCEETTESPNQSQSPAKPNRTNDKEKTKPLNKPQSESTLTTDKISNGGKNKKKLISIDVGGFHLSIAFPFW